MVNTSTVKDLDIERYFGKWYEIARFDHRSEKDMVGVTATYSYRSDGLIKVVNQGYLNSLDGPFKTSVGKAKIPDETKPGKFKVSFFWILYSDYNVMELDSLNYQWALVGSKSSNFLWILSRTEQLDADVKTHLINKIEERGYDLEKLIWVEHRKTALSQTIH
jgi:lipocalin